MPTHKQWPTLREVAKQLGVPHTVVENWVYKWCSALQRKMASRLETRVVKPVGKREVRTADPRDVDKVRLQRRTRPPRKSNPGLLTYSEIHQLYGWSRRLLRKWQKKGVPSLGGFKLIPVMDPILFTNGTRGLVQRDARKWDRVELDRIVQAEANVPCAYRDDEGTWLSDWAQRKKYGISCIYWRNHTHPRLLDDDGRKRKVRSQTIARRPRGHPREIIVEVDHEDDVRTIVNGRKVRLGFRGQEAVTPYTDDEGTWYTGRYAEEHFNVSRKTLALLRTVPSKHLGSRTIHFKPTGTDRPSSNRGAYLYSATDIADYVEARDRWRRSPGVGGRFGHAAATASSATILDGEAWTGQEHGQLPVKLIGPGSPVFVRGHEKPPLAMVRFRIIKALEEVWPAGLSRDSLARASHCSVAHKELKALSESDQDWASVIVRPGRGYRGGYRIASH